MSSTGSTPSPVDLSVRIGPLALKNPVIAASGTFGFGLDFQGLYHPSLLGGIVLKSVTIEPRPGNPQPRIAETPCGLLNSIGLENPGVGSLVRDELPKLESIDTCVIASIAGDKPGEFVELARRLSAVQRVNALEINISCPNQSEGGMAFGTSAKATESLVGAVRKATNLPIAAKLTPNVTDIVAIAKAAWRGGADAVSLVNTFLGMMVDWRTRKPSIAGINGRGGVSGPAIKPMALRMVRDVYKSVPIPVIGMGGISTAGDALEFMIAGAAAVQIGTANFVNPAVCGSLPAEIAALLRSAGIDSAMSIVGTLQD